MKIQNISAYKFITLNDCEVLQQQYRQLCKNLAIQGTILLSQEGINLNLAGEPSSIEECKKAICVDPRFNDLIFKESFSESIPFKRLLVKIKPEIITMYKTDLQPEYETVPYISPEQLKEQLDKNEDIVLIDVRNRYEIEYGTFQNALDLNLEQFSEFPEAIKHLPETLKNKPIVIACTGGIRCEKAGSAMLREGFQKVYQLHGGILNYFAKCGAAHYDRQCFVFDDRIAVEPSIMNS